MRTFPPISLWRYMRHRGARSGRQPRTSHTHFRCSRRGQPRSGGGCVLPVGVRLISNGTHGVRRRPRAGRRPHRPPAQSLGALAADSANGRRRHAARDVPQEHRVARQEGATERLPAMVPNTQPIRLPSASLTWLTRRSRGQLASASPRPTDRILPPSQFNLATPNSFAAMSCESTSSPLQTRQGGPRVSSSNTSSIKTLASMGEFESRTDPCSRRRSRGVKGDRAR